MLNVGGNWTALPERGPLNINEHVNFYAKVGALSYVRSHSLTLPVVTFDQETIVTPISH